GHRFEEANERVARVSRWKQFSSQPEAQVLATSSRGLLWRTSQVSGLLPLTFPHTSARRLWGLSNSNIAAAGIACGVFMRNSTSSLREKPYDEVWIWLEAAEAFDLLREQIDEEFVLVVEQLLPGQWDRRCDL